jgi:hypothetical protein
VHGAYFSDSRSWSHPPLRPPALMCHETSANESIGFSSTSCKSDFILILANLKFFMPFGHLKAVLFWILHFTTNESVCIRWMPPTSMPWILAQILDSGEQPNNWEIVYVQNITQFGGISVSLSPCWLPTANSSPDMKPSSTSCVKMGSLVLPLKNWEDFYLDWVLSLKTKTPLEVLCR